MGIITAPHKRTSSKSVSTSLLYNVDPNIPSRDSPSHSSPHAIKDRKQSLREWTFPKAGAGAGARQLTGHAPQGSSSSIPAAVGLHASVDSRGGGSQGAKRGMGAGSGLGMIKEDYPTSPALSSDQFVPQDHRHRITHSIAYAGSPTASPFPKTPIDLFRFAYSNLRRQKLSDLVYGVFFLACLLVFFAALTGTGVDPSSLPPSFTPPPAPPTPSRAARAWPQIGDPANVARQPKVVIPDTFLPRRGRAARLDRQDAVPADVHHPDGDSSHDVGEDFLRDSPDDPRLDDEHVHHVHHQDGKEALFEEHAVEHEHEEEALLAEEEVGDEEGEEGEVETFQTDSGPMVPLHIVDADDEEEDDDEDDEEDDDVPIVAEPIVEPVVEPEIVVEDLVSEDQEYEDPATGPEEPGSEDQRQGDAFRRPAGREGLEELRRERQAIGRERERWVANVREGRERVKRRLR